MILARQTRPPKRRWDKWGAVCAMRVITLLWHALAPTPAVGGYHTYANWAYDRLRDEQAKAIRVNERNGRPAMITACANATAGLPIPVIDSRDELGRIAEEEGFRIGAELGVKEGNFANTTLHQWKSCHKYVLVDIWAPQVAYSDRANRGQAAQEAVYHAALNTTRHHRRKIEVCRNFTTSCAELYADNYFDYIYVDARHDRQGVGLDLHAWWPKLRPGGIMAGDDYRTAPGKMSGQAWDLNADGTKDPQKLAVKGAVDDFSREVCRQILRFAGSHPDFPNWALRK